MLLTGPTGSTMGDTGPNLSNITNASGFAAARLKFGADADTNVVISAIGRTKDSKGRSSYAGDGLNLASFRESSELEFGADDAFILTPDGEDDDAVTLRHLKSRHGEARDISLTFRRALQRFEPAATAAPSPGEARKARSALAALWAKAGPAVGDDEEGDDA